MFYADACQLKAPKLEGSISFANLVESMGTEIISTIYDDTH
jgi:hypothetical protein